MFKNSVRQLEDMHETTTRSGHRMVLPASMTALRPLLPRLFRHQLTNTGDHDADEQLLSTIILHRSKGHLMRLGLALAEERISDRSDPVSAQQADALTLTREIFGKVFGDDADPERLLSMFVLRHMDMDAKLGKPKDMVGALDLAVTGGYGQTLKVCTSAFLHGVPGYSLDKSEHHVDPSSKSGGHMSSFLAQLNVIFSPMKTAFMDLVLAQHKAYDRDTVKRLASRLKDLTSLKLSEVYEALAEFCGYESWNHMSAALKDQEEAAA